MIMTSDNDPVCYPSTCCASNCRDDTDFCTLADKCCPTCHPEHCMICRYMGMESICCIVGLGVDGVKRVAERSGPRFSVCGNERGRVKLLIDEFDSMAAAGEPYPLAEAAVEAELNTLKCEYKFAKKLNSLIVSNGEPFSGLRKLGGWGGGGEPGRCKGPREGGRPHLGPSLRPSAFPQLSRCLVSAIAVTCDMVESFQDCSLHVLQIRSW